ncbi:MAG: hypothetical protein FJ125_10215, partial [Deltaproteobacteria bacterium]|nr:hypothetical protein [Deltaproteobacteria bacterium]
FPGGFSVDVPRAEKVRVRASNEHGEEFEVEAEGLFATALQHEMDHLDGLTILDRLGKLSRKLALKRYKKVLAEYLAGGDPEDEDQEEEQ